MNKEEFDVLINDILKIPQPKEELPVSSMCSINVEELRQVIEAFNKIPDYNILIKDNLKKDKEIKRLKNIIDELEKEFEEVFSKMEEKQVEISGRGYYYTDLIPIEVILEDIKELKESERNFTKEELEAEEEYYKRHQVPFKENYEDYYKGSDK